MKEVVFLAVDGGATKTTLSIQSAMGECLFEKTTTGTNYQAIGVDNVIDVLSALLNDAYHFTKLEKINLAVFAIAGIDTEADLSTVNSIIKTSLQNTPLLIDDIIVENDVHATLLGLTRNNPGALVISGTGSIAYGTDGNGNVVRSGGWGHLAGDEGSGYWIGRQILKAVFCSVDGRFEKPSFLKDLVYEKLEIDSIEQLMTWLYHPNYTNAQIASISSVITKAIALGDEQAIAIAREAAKELSLLVNATLRQIQYKDGPFTLYMNGGILRHNPMILNLLQHNVADNFPRISFVLCEENPIDYIIQRAIFALK